MASVPDVPKRILLWCVPRCLSTAFMRAIANVDDFEVWYEPYLMVKKMTEMTQNPDIMRALDSMKVDPASAPEHFYPMFDEGRTYSWVKEQLEGNFPGRRLVFVKEMVDGIHGHYADLPKGYRHTFLIRHPLKAFASLKRMSAAFPGVGNIDLDKHPRMMIPPGYFFKEMYELIDHVKEVYEPKPLIIDSDDLQANPVAVMKTYCREVGIPYDERIVNWSGDASYKNWMAPKELVGVIKMQGLHKNAVSGSSGFSEVAELPSRSDLPHDVLKLADASMGWYEKLHVQRLVL